MDIYKRALGSVIATVCACSAVAGIGLAAAPEAALAKVACALITGSGSTLQSEQQELWITEVGGGAISGGGANECTAAPTIEYNLPAGTGSGQGLEEFGVGTKKINKAKSSNGVNLDAFVGSDDPPTLTQMKEMEEASEEGHAGEKSKPLVVPVVAGPVSIIAHLPAGCTLTGSANVTNAHLEEVFLESKTVTWGTLLGASAVSGTSCNTNPIMVDVRSDSSGTSFALKQYFCQIDPKEWCEPGKQFATDAPEWPNLTVTPELPLHLHKAGATENKGSGGEIEAVEEEEDSIGYVNLANAAKAAFKLSATGESLFWLNVEENSSTKFADPLETGEKGNCPTEFVFPTGTEAEAKESMWDLIHLAKFGQVEAYPICTLTYDITWETFLIPKLEAEYAKTEEVANTTRAYFEFMASGGQALIALDYSPLPTKGKSVKTIAEEIAKKIKP